MEASVRATVRAGAGASAAECYNWASTRLVSARLGFIHYSLIKADALPAPLGSLANYAFFSDPAASDSIRSSIVVVVRRVK